MGGSRPEGGAGAIFRPCAARMLMHGAALATRAHMQKSPCAHTKHTTHTHTHTHTHNAQTQTCPLHQTMDGEIEDNIQSMISLDQQERLKELANEMALA